MGKHDKAFGYVDNDEGPPWAVTGSGGSGGIPASSLSYIEDHEIETAKKLIDEEFMKTTGKPFGMRVAGYYLACKIFTRPEELRVLEGADGKKVTLWAPPGMTDMDKFNSVAALVCGIGPQAFTGHDQNGFPRFPKGPACRIGDWISIPRQNAFLLQYRGVAFALIPDDMVLAIVEDPKDVTPINQKPLI